MITQLDCFATKIFEIEVPIDMSLNVLHEIKRKRTEIETVSRATQVRKVEEYATDYGYTVRLDSFEEVVKYLEDLFCGQGLNLEVNRYWTAIYNKTGNHGFHNHKLNIFDTTNYSGIMYLSNVGGTDFISSSPTSAQNTLYLQSQIGKIVLFPATLPHQFTPQSNDQNERVIVAFNCEMYT